MAIAKLNPKARFKIVSQFDDAVEAEKPDELQPPAEGAEAPKSRYEQYIESDFDESKLKFKEGMKPDRIIIRALTADELAEINSKHIVVDTVGKKFITTERNKMFLTMFKMTFEGIESGDGSVSKPSFDEIPFQVQTEMGSIVSLITTLGKNLKKP